MSACFILVSCVLVTLFTGSQACSGNPGFSVSKLSDDASTTVNNVGDIVKFDVASVTNEDSAYDTATGKATIQTSGMYFVQFSIASIRKPSKDGDALFALVRNGNPLVKCENDPREDSQEVSCTNGVFMSLNEGDILWVKFDWVASDKGCLLKGNHQSSFTAFRVGG